MLRLKTTQYSEFLRASEMLCHSDDAAQRSFFIKDRSSSYLGCSKRYSTLTGFTSTQLVNKRDDDNLPWAEFADMYREVDREILAGKTTLHIEPIIFSCGNPFCILTEKQPIVAASGEVFGVLGSISVLSDSHSVRNSISLSAMQRGVGLGAEKSVQLIDNYNVNGVQLSPAESLILFLLLRGFTPLLIATRLSKSKRTIENHILHVREKFEVNSREDLIEFSVSNHLYSVVPRAAIRLGLV